MNKSFIASSTTTQSLHTYSLTKTKLLGTHSIVELVSAVVTVGHHLNKLLKDLPTIILYPLSPMVIVMIINR